jgi:hypothetical protein
MSDPAPRGASLFVDWRRVYSRPQELPLLFKTTSHFDSTAQNPEWLGGDSALVKELAAS